MPLLPLWGSSVSSMYLWNIELQMYSVIFCTPYIKKDFFINLYAFIYFLNIIIIIICLLMSPLLGHSHSLWITHKENGPEPTARAQWRLVGANDCKCSRDQRLPSLLNHGGA
jgi:hypothetical protein